MEAALQVEDVDFTKIAKKAGLGPRSVIWKRIQDEAVQRSFRTFFETYMTLSASWHGTRQWFWLPGAIEEGKHSHLWRLMMHVHSLSGLWRKVWNSLVLSAVLFYWWLCPNASVYKTLSSKRVLPVLDNGVAVLMKPLNRPAQEWMSLWPTLCRKPFLDACVIVHPEHPNADYPSAIWPDASGLLVCAL